MESLGEATTQATEAIQELNQALPERKKLYSATKPLPKEPVELAEGQPKPLSLMPTTQRAVQLKKLRTGVNPRGFSGRHVRQNSEKLKNIKARDKKLEKYGWGVLNF
jgi:hypothetical protein